MNCPYCFIRPLRQQKGAATCGDSECVRRNNNSHKKRLAMQRDNIDAVNSVVVFDRVRWCYVRRTPPSRKRVRILPGWEIPESEYYSDRWTI